MSKSHPENFRSKLLQQDQALHSERYKEHRMQLEQQLIRAETRERLAKRVVVGAVPVGIAALLVIASGVFGSPDPGNKDATVISVGAGVIYFVALSVVLIGAASYYSRFRPRVRRAREELRDESLLELRREVAELRQLMEERLKARE